MNGPKGESCLECYFFEESISMPGVDAELTDDEIISDELHNGLPAGCCHRFPPRHQWRHDGNEVDTVAVSSAVWTSDWCGEYQPRDSEPKHEDLLTRKEAADFLGMQSQTLAVWAVKQIGPTYIKVGARARYRRSDLETWLAANRKEHE